MVEGVRKAGCVSQLRKAVRGTDSLLFATEGRIGSLVGRASFLQPQSHRAPKEEGVPEELFSGACTRAGIS